MKNPINLLHITLRIQENLLHLTRTEHRRWKVYYPHKGFSLTKKALNPLVTVLENFMMGPILLLPRMVLGSYFVLCLFIILGRQTPNANIWSKGFLQIYLVIIDSSWCLRCRTPRSYLTLGWRQVSLLEVNRESWKSQFEGQWKNAGKLKSSCVILSCNISVSVFYSNSSSACWLFLKLTFARSPQKFLTQRNVYKLNMTKRNIQHLRFFYHEDTFRTQPLNLPSHYCHRTTHIHSIFNAHLVFTMHLFRKQ